MKLIEKILYFKPSFTLRALTGLVAFALIMAACMLAGITDASANGLAKRDEAWAARNMEQGAKVYYGYCAGCHGVDGRGAEGKGPAVSSLAFLGKVDENGLQVTASERMKELKWQGSVQQYIEAVTASGIPPSGAFDEIHAQWSNRYSGPLRDDEIKNVAAFIMNWAKAPMTDGNIVAAPKPGAGAAPKATAVPLTAAQEAGKQVYLKNGCTACHSIKGMAGGGNIGPNLSAIATLAETRIKDAGYKGTAKTGADYLHESVVSPAAYLVPQCPTGACLAGVMPATFGTTLKPEELTQLLDYLSALK